MSRGFPSMTALLGLLAVAGYQNRDKIAEMLRGASSSNPGASEQGQPGGLGGLLGGLGSGGVGGLLGGGLTELIDRFKQAGQGEVADSWINKGPNQPVAPHQLEQAIPPDVLATLADQTGLSREEILSRLCRKPWTGTPRMDASQPQPKSRVRDQLADSAHCCEADPHRNYLAADRRQA